jgi:hypothetical protein
MNAKPRGEVIIINVQKGRPQTDFDRDNLTKLFKQLHFEVKVFNDIEDKDNLTAEVTILN